MQARMLHALVVVVPIVMYAVFQTYRRHFEPKVAHLFGMATYWVVLSAISLAVLGRAGITRVIESFPDLNAALWLCLALPVVLAFAFGPFAKQIPLVTPRVFLLSAMLAIVNASLEECFWRGVYVYYFSSPLTAWLFPAVGFAIWHFAPLSVIPYRKGSAFFVLSSFLLGLCWGLVAFKTKSIGWNIVSHILVDFSGFGALLYLGRR